MAEYDLTAKFVPYLDSHLVFPLLEFHLHKSIYDANDIYRTTLQKASKTCLADFTIELYSKLDLPIPDDLLDRRENIIKETNKLKEEISSITDIFAKETVIQELDKQDRADFRENLIINHGYDPSLLEPLYKFTTICYGTGYYAEAAYYLNVYSVLVKESEKNYLSALWGKLASVILTHKWDDALEDLNRLKEFIDNKMSSAPLQLLQQRTWLIHWSLFVFFNHPKGRDLVIEMFLYQPAYLNAIQTTCPHILRYLATAVVIMKNNRRQFMRDLVKVIQQESYTYKDPITEFLAHLYVDFDFDAAQEKLKQCNVVLENDFFLVACLKDFIENARLLIFELFCRIHQCISIDMLAKKLNMTTEDAEKWNVNLIRQAKLDAKIDSQQGHVVMGTQAISPYQQLIDKTKNLSFRTQTLSTAVEKKAASSWNQEVGKGYVWNL